MTISRKKRPLDRRIPHKKDTRLFIIATEGKETEKQYFSLFRYPKVQVKVLNTNDGKSAPKYVLQRLSDFKNEFGLNKEDELWLMIDVDRWEEKELSEITQNALQKKIKLAISNPCFEVWLYLHFATISINITICKNLKALLRQRLGSYNSSNLRLSDFKDHIHDAIKYAREIDITPNARWPQKPGTHVYKVVEKILELK